MARSETSTLLLKVTGVDCGDQGDWPPEEVLMLRALDACMKLQRQGAGDQRFREQLNQMIGSLKFELRDRGREEI